MMSEQSEEVMSLSCWLATRQTWVIKGTAIGGVWLYISFLHPSRLHVLSYFVLSFLLVINLNIMLSNLCHFCFSVWSYFLVLIYIWFPITTFVFHIHFNLNCVHTCTMDCGRQVSVETAEKKARDLGVMYIETSAKAGYNVKQVGDTIEL